MSDQEPNWSLLPYRAEEFFGLAQGYGLQDLRRAYGRLIRIYKPERSPKEFQQIRAAYELLDAAVRYGTGSDASVEINNPGPVTRAKRGLDPSRQLWEEPEPESPLEEVTPPVENTQEPIQNHEPVQTQEPIQNPEPSKTQKPRRHPEPRRKPIWERLETESAADIYAELKQQPQKSRRDYTALAILSDLIATAAADSQSADTVRDGPLTFTRWLLLGLDEYPEDPGLLRMLQAHLADPVPPDTSLSLVELIARHIKTDTYYRLTERLWLRLLRQLDFERFREALENCESLILDSQSDHRIVFYLSLLRPAFWKADEAWLEQKRGQIEFEYRRLPTWAEEELEFLDQLREYRDLRQAFVLRGSIQQLMDRAILNYCSADELAADLGFLECQHALACSSDEILHSFPLDKTDYTQLLLVWSGIAKEVSSRARVQEQALSPKSFERRVRGLAVDLVGDSNNGCLYGGLVVLVMIVALVFAFHHGSQAFTALFFHGALFDALRQAGGVFGVLVIAGTVVYLGLDLHQQMLRRRYLDMWRPRILTFLESGPYVYSEVVNVMHGLTKSKDDTLSDTDEVAKFMKNDVALEIYLTAHRLLVG